LTTRLRSAHPYELKGADFTLVEPWFVLWLFTVTGKIYISSYGIEIDWEFEDQTFVPARTRSTAESQLSRGTARAVIGRRGNHPLPASIGTSFCNPGEGKWTAIT